VASEQFSQKPRLIVWAEYAKALIEPIAIVLGGVWIFFTFTKEKFIDPAAEPANVSISARLIQRVTSIPGDLVPFLVELTVSNPSTVRSYVPLSKWRLFASTVEPGFVEHGPFLDLIDEAFQPDTVKLGHRTFHGGSYQLLSTGKVFPNDHSWLDPKENYSRHILVFVPKSSPRIRLMVDTWACRTLKDWKIQWHLDRASSDLSSPVLVTPEFQHKDWLGRWRVLRISRSDADRTLVDKHFAHTDQMVDQVVEPTAFPERVSLPNVMPR
jgi:hypothetical protein